MLRMSSSASVRGFGEDFDVVDSIRNDIDLIKSIPGVVTATVSNHVPLSGSGSGTGLRTVARRKHRTGAHGALPVERGWSGCTGCQIIQGPQFSARGSGLRIARTDDPPHRLPSWSPRNWRTTCFRKKMRSARRSTGAAWSRRPSSALSAVMHGSWVGWDKLENVVIQPGKPAVYHQPVHHPGRAWHA